MKILLPIDGSDCSKTTLEWASNFLSKANSRIFLINVIYFTPDAFVGDYEVEEGIKMLNEAKEFMESRGFIVEDTKYLLGLPSQAICDYADENNVDQIIIGSHGRQGLAKFLMGSVSEGVFKHAKQPVLVLNNSPQASSLSISHPDKVNISQKD